MRAQTVCFTGHRKIPLEQYAPLHQRLEGVVIDLIDRGYCFFGAGGAMGFDTMAAQVVLTLRQWHPQLRLFWHYPVCIRPNIGRRQTKQSMSTSKRKRTK